ncbi:hypothetical protein [Streptomyces sp. MBT53]|uniref:hypothetical protein n=1 Tax=Streptomyces sp. MBT53 TaxID=1488384 RepID=UPI001912FAAC|nr:hypothetical protein [Streptomyces sp. MBT53]MBK6016362.1 hypothetical protein [Streptomyces sp. MBT53]
MSLLATRRLGRVLRCLVAAALSVATVVVAAASAHAVTITLILTSADGGMLCGYGYPNPVHFVSTNVGGADLDPSCQWTLKAVGDNYYVYNTGIGEYITLAGNPAKGVSLLLKPLLSGASAVNLQQFNFSSQTGNGGVAIRPTNNLDLNINRNGYDPNNVGVMLTTWDQNRRSMSWQFTMVDPVATPPKATLTPAPFSVGSYGLLVDQSARPLAGSPRPGMALCADTDDSNVRLQLLSRSINPYCIWQKGRPDGIPSNVIYLYNPATGKVLDINGSGPLNDPTPVNLQPFYTNPLQTYEWWNPATTDLGYTAFRPSGNYDLNLNGYSAAFVQPAAVTSWSTGLTQAQMSWSFIPL